MSHSNNEPEVNVEETDDGMSLEVRVPDERVGRVVEVNLSHSEVGELAKQIGDAYNDPRFDQYPPDSAGVDGEATLGTEVGVERREWGVALEFIEGNEFVQRTTAVGITPGQGTQLIQDLASALAPTFGENKRE